MSPESRAFAASADMADAQATLLDLVTQAGNGDTAAFGILVDTRLDGLFRTASAILGNEADARDATQEAFTSAWIKLPQLRDADRFDAWLHRALVNRCRDMLRRRGRVREISLDALNPSLADAAPASPSRSALEAAFEHLPIASREILVLHHLHDMPVVDVARRLGIPEGTAKWRLFRARRALERYLEAQR